jgi:hypothetical protein
MEMVRRTSLDRSVFEYGQALCGSERAFGCPVQRTDAHIWWVDMVFLISVQEGNTYNTRRNRA